MVLDLIESSRIEFKVKMVDNLEETIIAFLNSKDGGIIYLGINDKEKIIGLNGNLDLLQRKVKDRIISNIEPSALGLFDLEILEKDNKKLIDSYIEYKKNVLKKSTNLSKEDEDIINNFINSKWRNKVRKLNFV